MKKITDKIITEEKETNEKNDDSNEQLSISCDCCTSPSSQEESKIKITSPSFSNVNPIIELEDKEIHKHHVDDKEVCDYDDDDQDIHTKRSIIVLNEKLLIVIGLTLTIPIVLLDIIFPDSYLTNFVILALATPVQILLGRPFYTRFVKRVKQRKGFTTDTLVVLSTSVAYSYSIITILTGSYALQFFEASASVLTIFTIGEYLESRVLKTTSESLRTLLALKPKKATVIRDGKEIIIDSDNIVVGDIVVAKPGEKIATDGIVVYGESSVDESMITGESIPFDKKIGDKVIGGTINNNGYIQFKVTSVGSNTVLASIIDMVKKARMSKAPVQRIADRSVHYFIPIVLSIAIAASLYWLFVVHQPISFAITVFATILVVSCPCALGIATPMVISLGIDKAARHGILIKGGQYLEKLSSINIIVFDKTGTLTKGKPEVTDIIPIVSNEYEVLQLASSAESRSEHPIAQAIVQKAAERSLPLLEIAEFNSFTGQGVIASYSGKMIFVGSIRKMESNSKNNEERRIIRAMNSTISGSLQTKITDLELEGKTVVGVFVEDKLVGLIAIADTLRENARQVVDEIQHNLKKEIILMSGDNERTAKAIAKKLGITKILAQVSPETKALEIKKLQNQGKKVAMIGDGINDAPALTQADIGIALGSGTDVALSSGHIILMKADLYYILYALNLAKYCMKKIKQNLSMSFAYNVITISIASGLFYSITNSLVLTPTLAALGWVISDSAVFGNSLLIRKYNLFK